jgi:hypothetical protein
VGNLLATILKVLANLFLYAQGRKSKEAEQTEEENDALKDRAKAERGVDRDDDYRRRVLDSSTERDAD